MPLYELSIIAKGALQRSTQVNTLADKDKAQWKQILTFCAKYILDNKGVVRDFKYHGVKELPYRMKSFQEIHSTGCHLAMQFDSSPPTMKRLQKALSLNEGIIRHTTLKMGSKLSQITNYVPVEDVRGKLSVKKSE